MNEAPELLSTGVLDQLLRRWRDAGAQPLIDATRNGLTNEQMARRVSHLGLKLPVEARVWWAWRDGISAEDARAVGTRNVGPGMRFYPLDEAVRTYEETRRVLREHEEEAALGVAEEIDAPWPPNYLLFGYTNAPVVCDCAVPDGAPSPVRLLNYGDRGEKAEVPVARSMGELVLRWLDGFDAGAYEWLPDPGRWDRDFERIPEPLRRTWIY